MDFILFCPLFRLYFSTIAIDFDLFFLPLDDRPCTDMAAFSYNRFFNHTVLFYHCTRHYDRIRHRSPFFDHHIIKDYGMRYPP